MNTTRVVRSAVLLATLLLVYPANAAADLVPEDTCIIEVQVPSGTRVALDGMDQGTTRRFTYRPLAKGKMFPINVAAVLRGGRRVEKKVLIKGGWRVRVPVAPDNAPQLVVQSGHTGYVSSVALSGDGRRVLTGSWDNTAILWDAAAGTKLRTFAAHTELVSSVALSGDGRRALTGSWDNTAILWDTATGSKLRTFSGHDSAVTSVALSGNGHRALTGSSDMTAIVWDSSTGTKLNTFVGHTNKVLSVSLSGDGRRVLTGSSDMSAILWNGVTGKKLRTFVGHTNAVSSVALSGDGRRVLTGSWDETAILWDATAGAKLRTFVGHADWVNSAALSADGRRVLTGSDDKTAILWDASVGTKLRTFAGHTNKLWSVALSGDGRRVLTGSTDTTAIMWDANNGTRLGMFAGHTISVRSVAMSREGGRILIGSDDKMAILWDAARGIKSRVLTGHTSIISTIALSGDGHRALTGSYDNTAILWDASTGTKLNTFAGHTNKVLSVTLSGDGRRVLTGSSDRSAILWDTATRAKLRTFAHHISVRSVALSHDASHVLTGSFNAHLWNAGTGRKLRTFGGRNGIGFECVALSDDGRRMVTGTYNKTAILWDTTTGTKLRTFKGHTHSVNTVGLSGDARLVLGGSYDKTAILWDSATGAKLRMFVGHTGSESSVALSGDGSRVLSASADGTARLWDIATGDELCRLISLDKGKDWLVVTPEGLFDGSEGGMKKVMFRIGKGLNVVPVSRFFQDFHREGLLARIWRGERPMPNVDVSKANPPTVTLISPDKGGETGSPVVTVEVEVKDKGAGVKGPFLRHNGAKVAGEPKVRRMDAKTSRHTFTVALQSGENQLRVEAASGDGAWESEPAQIAFTYSKSLPKPDLYVLAVGVNGYAADSLKLSYAATDAKAIGELFTKRGGAFYEKIHITTLLDKKATKTGIRAALRDIAAKARTQDTLLVHFSGHGFTVGQRYYFIPQEFRFASKKFQDDVEDQCLPGDQIFRAMGESKALKRVLILDTCNSGAVLQKSGTKQRNAFAFAGAIRRLARSQGIFTLAASSASDEAAEIRELKHGVLTYTLLHGMKAVPGTSTRTADGNGDGVVNISEWFGYAADEVPKLTKKYRRIQQDVHQRSEGVSFPVLPLPRN